MKTAIAVVIAGMLALSVPALAKGDKSLAEIEQQVKALDNQEHHLTEELSKVAEQKKALLDQKLKLMNEQEKGAAAPPPPPVASAPSADEAPKWKSDLPEGWDEQTPVPVGGIPLEKLGSTPYKPPPKPALPTPPSADQDIGRPVVAPSPTSPATPQPKRWN